MVGQSDPRPALSDHLEQRRVGQGHAWTRQAQLGNHLAAVCDQDLLPAADQAEVLAQTVLQLANPPLPS